MSRVDWLVLATHVPPGGALGGVVRYTTELVAALARRDDVRLSVLTTQAAAPTLDEVMDGNGYVRTLPRRIPSAALPLWERHVTLPSPAPDVVHGVKHLLPRTGRGLRVLTVHDMVLLDRPGDFGRAKRSLLPGPYRASIRQADLLLSVSAATERRLLVHEPGVRARSDVVPLATAASLRDAPPREVPFLRGRRFALVVGDASPRKNLGAVVDAWPEVQRRVPDAVLAVAGPPSWGRSELGRAYSCLVASGALIPLGRIDDAQLRWCYEHSAVVLCPSLAEGFGLPAAEALELGATVLISEDPALQEVAAGRARAVVPADNYQRWSGEITAALLAAGGASTTSARVRTWDDVAADTAAAVYCRLPASPG